MGNKILKTTGIFDDIDYLKSWGVTCWAERIGSLVDHIIQFSCCTAFRAIQKNHMLFFEYFKIGCMYLDNFFFIWKVWSGAMLVTIFRTVKSITAFSVTKKPQKSRKKAELSWGNTKQILQTNCWSVMWVFFCIDFLTVWSMLCMFQRLTSGLCINISAGALLFGMILGSVEQLFLKKKFTP